MILGFLPPLITVALKGWIPIWLAGVAMFALVVGLVFGIKRLVQGVVLPVFSVAIFAVVNSAGDGGKLSAVLEPLIVLATVLLGV